MLPATVFGFRLKRSIPLHLAWWYFYVNLPNITGNPENASHSKQKRSIRSSLANLLPQKDLTNLKILISYHSNHIISLSLYLNNIRREKIKSRSLQWILKLSLWWISFKMTPHLWWSSWYPFLWSRWAHLMVVMITKPSWWSGWFPLRWSRWSGRRSPLSVLWPAPPSLLLHQVGIACPQRTKLCQRLKYTRAEQPRENVAKEVG